MNPGPAAMLGAYIYDGIRTPFGRHAGALSSVRPDDLLAHALRAVLGRSDFDAARFEDVIAGCVNQAGEDNRNVARFAGLLAGFPVTVGGLTVNRLCGSSMAAVLDAARCITVGEGHLFMAGGVESMSRAPFVIAKPDTGFSRQAQIYDTTISVRFPNPEFARRYGLDSMPETADNVATELHISRVAADDYAFASQQRYELARRRGFFEPEICPIPTTPSKKNSDPVIVVNDEHPRADSDRDQLAKLKPLFPDGVVTAGNASGVNDGAAALVLGSLEIGQEREVAPRGRILAGAIAGVEPRLMGLGPAQAIPKALARAGLTLRDMDVIELNEAFATQVLGCLELLGLDAKDTRVNPNGGAIAVGHPLGASGARLVLTGLRQLEHSRGRFALLSMCIGVGQGIALVIERCPP